MDPQQHTAAFIHTLLGLTDDQGNVLESNIAGSAAQAALRSLGDDWARWLRMTGDRNPARLGEVLHDLTGAIEQLSRARSAMCATFGINAEAAKLILINNDVGIGEVIAGANPTECELHLGRWIDESGVIFFLRYEVRVSDVAVARVVPGREPGDAPFYGQMRNAREQRPPISSVPLAGFAEARGWFIQQVPPFPAGPCWEQSAA